MCKRSFFSHRSDLAIRTRFITLVMRACIVLGLCANSMAQSISDLVNDARTTDDIVTYGMGYNLQRFSPLDQINTETVGDLVPVWSFGLADERGQEAQPMFYGDTLFITTHKNTFAVDARSGRLRWRHDVNYPKQALRNLCCGIVNRGAALYDGKLYRATVDAQLLAIDIETGKEVWRSQQADWKESYSGSSAPLIANGVLIAGIAGGDQGTRGFLDGWDPQTGKQLWRKYTVPLPGETGGDTWPAGTHELGGGATWITGSYDPELDLVYWGVGNPSPWSAVDRPGDNLYTNSIIALRPKTGEWVWYYQMTPNDTYDYDGVNEPILTTLTIDGKPRKVVMQANRNGYFYVLDRKTGELLRANQYVDKLTWAKGIDMKTGRPIRSEETLRNLKYGVEVKVWPSALGAKNWAPGSYSPKTGLVYVNSNELSMTFKPVDIPFRRGTSYFKAEFNFPDVNTLPPTGRLRAIEPVTGKRVWEMAIDPPPNGGTLVTAGDLVFTGLQTGELIACDAHSGEEMWRYQTGSGIIAPPVTYELDGEQYVAVLSGSGAIVSWFFSYKDMTQVNKGGFVTVFRLHRRGKK